MPNYDSQLLSKICDENDAKALTRYGLEREDFASETAKRAYDAIRTYAESNGGQAPSYATLVAEVDGFNYVPAVTDSYEFLARKIKDYSGKAQVARFFNEELPELFESGTADSVIDAVHDRLVRIKMGTSVRSVPGRTLDEIAQDFRAEYDRRKAGESFRLWKTPFPTLNAEIGGLYAGDIYGIMAESGRGKTYLAEVIVDELLRQGANVLVKSYEVKAYPWVARLLSVITAREGALEIDDIADKVGLPNKAMLSGSLEGDVEAYFFEICSALSSYYPGQLYLQAKSDAGLTRSLDALERELAANPSLDCVVIDAFYNLEDTYGRNANKTAGGAAEQAARRLERIIGENDVVGIYTVQAATERQETDEDTGRRELKLPDRDRMKTTKALLEITTNLFAFDAVNGLGRIGVEKGRNGGEGFTLDLVALMDYGVLREMPAGAEVASQFVGNF
ncbi:DnaB-like helicase C-terminal domain-containing protein [Paenibacillus humicus]|uniref:DnaB-like helicase C-terminal domain-containing protein n=1 Tax=Paenibacillus humicus TaxID=412861 RepID=UPI000FDBBBF9|nr:DnaB-like helicase C-terminal domain-containing protein [Paenibacillus humicus]